MANPNFDWTHLRDQDVIREDRQNTIRDLRSEVRESRAQALGRMAAIFELNIDDSIEASACPQTDSALMLPQAAGRLLRVDGRLPFVQLEFARQSYTARGGDIVDAPVEATVEGFVYRNNPDETGSRIQPTGQTLAVDLSAPHWRQLGRLEGAFDGEAFSEVRGEMQDYGDDLRQFNSVTNHQGQYPIIERFGSGQPMHEALSGFMKQLG